MTSEINYLNIAWIKGLCIQNQRMLDLEEIINIAGSGLSFSDEKENWERDGLKYMGAINENNKSMTREIEMSIAL